MPRSLTKEQQTLKPGQDLDLGDVVFAPRNQQQPQQNETQKPGDKPKGPDGAADSSPDKTAAPKAAVARTENSVISTESSVPDSKSSPAANKSEPNAAKSRTIRGRVVDSTGKPLGGVPLQMPAIGSNKNVDGTPEISLVTKATTGDDGRFVVEIPGGEVPASSGSLPLKLVAQRAQYGIEWLDIPDQGDVPAAEIVLFPEQA